MKIFIFRALFCLVIASLFFSSLVVFWGICNYLFKGYIYPQPCQVGITINENGTWNIINNTTASLGLQLFAFLIYLSIAIVSLVVFMVIKKKLDKMKKGELNGKGIPS